VTEQVAVVENLVGELVATGALSPEQVADIERFVVDAKAGTLWADDLNYLIALHAKVTGAPAPEVDGVAPPSGPDSKFAEIRRRFAERFDPETGTADLDPTTRAKVYDAFWAEFEAVGNS
jgi:hypothetical protein